LEWGGEGEIQDIGNVHKRFGCGRRISSSSLRRRSHCISAGTAGHRPVIVFTVAGGQVRNRADTAKRTFRIDSNCVGGPAGYWPTVTV
jgi:hypothetical protein